MRIVDFFIRLFNHKKEKKREKKYVRLYKYAQGFSNEDWQKTFGIDRPSDYDAFILIECDE